MHWSSAVCAEVWTGNAGGNLLMQEMHHICLLSCLLNSSVCVCVGVSLVTELEMVSAQKTNLYLHRSSIDCIYFFLSLEEHKEV